MHVFQIEFIIVQMLKQIGILFQSAFTKDKESLEKLADEIEAIVKKRGNKTYKMKDSSISRIISFCDNSISTQCRQSTLNFSLLNEFSLFHIVFQTSKMFPNFEKPRLYSTIILSTFPTKQIVQKLFLSAGLPNNYLEISTLSFYSFLQVFLLRKTCGFYTHSLVNFTTSVVSIATINYVVNIFAEKLSKRIGFVSKGFLCQVLGLFVGPLIHQIGLYGVRNGIVKIVDSIFFHFYKKLYPTPIKLDFEPENIPDSMICPICNDLITEPLEIDGFLFCRECIDHWVAQSDRPLHPATGMPMVVDAILPNTPMNYVISKYKKILQDEHNQAQHN